MDFDTILKAAHAAAHDAVKDHVEDPNAFDCGFAWVTVSGNEPIARHCRKASKDPINNANGGLSTRQFYGSKSYTVGWQWWTPGGFGGQAISIHEAGARAFRDVLALHGIRADVGSRYD